MKEKAYDLRPIWNAILDVYLVVKELCERHGLRMFVAYGTEIGAMRHHGFIPWDDDFDVCMPRPDYVKFMEIAEKELPDYLEWHSIDNDPGYSLMFGKVVDNRKDVLARVRNKSGLNLEQGVFIDFFPLDGLPSTKLGVLCWNLRRSILRKTLDQRSRALSWRNCFYKVVALSLPKFKTAQERRMYIQNWISKIPYEKAINVGWLLSMFRYPKFVKKRVWYSSAKLVPFENVMVPVPVGVEEDLHTMYGDYLRLPPEDQRKPSHQLAGS